MQAHYIVRVNRTCRPAGRGGQWCNYDSECHHFDSVTEAVAWVRAQYRAPSHERPFSGKSSPVYQDTKSRRPAGRGGTIQSGWVFSGKEDQQDRSKPNGRSVNYLQDWVTIERVLVEPREGKPGEVQSVDVRNIKKVAV